MPCSHFSALPPLREPAHVCEDCVREGTRWVHLRQCLVCGHVGCCDDSPRRHASRHFQQTRHAVLRSAEPGEDWAWCFLDRALVHPFPGVSP